MAELSNLAAFLPIICVLEVLSIVFTLLFMHYSAKYRNKNLSLGWYICGVLFGLWTVIIFLIKRRDFLGPETKICSQCNDIYPDNVQECSKCHIDLPQVNPDEKKKQKKLSRRFGVAIIVTYISALIIGIIIGIMASNSILDAMDIDDRIPVNGVFYDKMGNSYENDEDVLLYDEEGRIYTYTVEEYIDEEDEYFTYEEYYYVRDDGKKYLVSDCYVTEDGWFYCDKAFVLELYAPDTSTMTDEELDAYYEELLEQENEEYKYYDYPYTDKYGNFYYCAYEASWNENSELITAENDIHSEE